MKTNYIRIIISSLIILSATKVYSSVAVYPFRERAQRSDLIVEGVVEKQTEIHGYDRTDLNSFRMRSVLKVAKVYEGNITAGDTITIFSHMNFVCDTSSKLAHERRYLLMLKTHGLGFADVNYGRGMWEIVTLASDKEFVVGDLWARTWGQSYEEFQDNLVWALSEPPSWPEEPTISTEEAKKIALDALCKANVDLKGFELKKEKLLNIGSEMVGIAHKGDPMWLFDWAKPEAQGRSPRPAGTFVFCYVHAHTGKYYSGPNLYREIPVDRNVRLFLKTHHRSRQIYNKHADNINISRIAEEEFRNLLPRVKRIFLKEKPSYPENATFLKVEFLDSVELNALIFVFDAVGRIKFVGEWRREASEHSPTQLQRITAREKKR